jgi:hypothetical protein
VLVEALLEPPLGPPGGTGGPAPPFEALLLDCCRPFTPVELLLSLGVLAAPPPLLPLAWFLLLFLLLLLLLPATSISSVGSRSASPTTCGTMWWDSLLTDGTVMSETLLVGS